MGFDELFGKSSPGSQKDEITNANTRPKVNSSILGAVGQAFNQAKTHEYNSNNISSEKQAVINARVLQEIKAYPSEVAESIDPSDSSDNSSDSDETESSDSSVTRVEHIKNQVKTGSNFENSHQNSVGMNTGDQTSKKARAKVSANMIISDFSSLQLHPKNHKEQFENSSLTSPTSWIETNNESGRDNAVRRPRVKASTISEENASFQYKKSNIVGNQPRKVSFDSNSDATLRSEQVRSDIHSDVSWGSDPGKLPYNNSSNLISSRPKVRTTNSNYSSYLSQFQDDNYTHNMPYQMNPRSNSTLSNNKKSWSDVTYGESRTVISHNSDPGPRRKIFSSDRNNDMEYYEEENTVDADQEELEELMSMSSNPKIQRKLLDLKIANSSLLTLNSTLEETIKKHSSNLNAFESMTDVQQLQLNHITKVEELMRELSVKISSQESEIKSLKSKLEEDNSEQQKVSQSNMNNKSNENFIFTLGKLLILALLYGTLFLNFKNIWNLLKSSLEYLYSMIQETSQ